MGQRGSRAHIDLAELEKLSVLQCTDEEIGAWFNVSTRTIERRRKVPKFAEVMDRGKAKGRISVRRMQMKLLEAGNATMGVWLGKQLLGQTDQLVIPSRLTSIREALRAATPKEIADLLNEQISQYPQALDDPEIAVLKQSIDAEFTVVGSAPAANRPGLPVPGVGPSDAT
jgi:hypothetical protein